MVEEMINYRPPAPASKGGVVPIEQHRAIQEVQASLVIAKTYKRDPNEAILRIETACKRPALAKEATYAYPRGGTTVTGPSIRLAEVLAQNWGNLDFGIRELSQSFSRTQDGSMQGVSEVEAYAWDMETNVRQRKVFNVPHTRYTRKHGISKLTDPRDIYEMVANQGARRLRACILGVIPGDVVDAALDQCETTLNEGGGAPLEDRIREMLRKFAEVGVDKDMIEAKLGHKVTAIVQAQLTMFHKIYNSLKDGMSTRDQWFSIPAAGESEASQSLDTKISVAAEKQNEEDKWGEFYKSFINLKSGYPDFVKKYWEMFMAAPVAVLERAKEKWYSSTMKAHVGDEPWPGDIVEKKPADADLPQHVLTLQGYIANIGEEAYREALAICELDLDIKPTDLIDNAGLAKKIVEQMEILATSEKF
jgi:hypothetical protein